VKRLAKKTSQRAAGPSFDEALKQVEGIVARIESGEIGLEESIAEYERGAALIKACRESLQRAEQRVRDLTAQMNADSGPGVAPEDKDEDDGEETDAEDAPF
jgi:exodeoxyribonuclease VII small subunit